MCSTLRVQNFIVCISDRFEYFIMFVSAHVSDVIERRSYNYKKSYIRIVTILEFLIRINEKGKRKTNNGKKVFV